MISVLSLSFFHNLFLGLEFTYLIPQTKHVLFVTVILSVFTGNFLVSLTPAWRQTWFMGPGYSLPSSLAQRCSF